MHVQQLPERCYALSLCYPLMVVGTADRNVIVFNLQNPQVILLSSPLWSSRCLSLYSGYAIIGFKTSSLIKYVTRPCFMNTDL